MTMSLVDIETCGDVSVLVEQLTICSGSILENIETMAKIIRRLDELGADVQIDNGMLPYIRLVAHNNLPASCVSALCGDTKLLDQVCRLPRPDQLKIASNEPLRVMEIGGDFRMVRPLEMTRAERQQVFGANRMRTDSEQIGFLREKIQRAQAKVPPPSPRPISIDRKRKGLVVGELFIPLSELAGYVSSLSQ